MTVPAARLNMATAMGMAMIAPAARLATATSWLELLSVSDLWDQPGPVVPRLHWLWRWQLRHHVWLASLAMGTALAVVHLSRCAAMATLLAMAMAVPAACLNMATAIGMAIIVPPARLATAISWLELLSG